MKKITLFIVLFLVAKTIGQVGINTTSPNSLLEIKSSNQALPSNTDGLLIPKIDNFPAINPTITQNGMMVYLTTAIGTNLPGFYYWDDDNTTWKILNAAQSLNNWSINGNNNTNNTHFIGTTTNNDILFKRNSVSSGQIGTSNTSFGFNSFTLATGNRNNAFGVDALQGNTTGNDNVAIGNRALYANTTGINSVGIGSNALTANTTGGVNTAVGTNALTANTIGTSNTGIGANSLQANTTGINNTGIGAYALFSATTARDNVAIGLNSMFSTTTGINNTAIGSFSLQANTTGARNVANGVNALLNNTTGGDNVANGYSALIRNTTGICNTANGNQSLERNTSGGFNTGNGIHALFSNTTGSRNIANGAYAGNLITTGSNNIVIGYNAQVPINTGDNQIRIGDTNITYAGTQVAWTITSDRRWKNSIQPSNLGLKFIQKLNPVSYIRNNDASKKVEYGFIAQELESALIESGAIRSGIINKDDKEMLSVRYNDLLAPMVKAIQEQQEIINNYEKQLKALEEKMKTLEVIISKQEN